MLFFFFCPLPEKLQLPQNNQVPGALTHFSPALGRLALEVMGHKPALYPLLLAALPVCTHTHTHTPASNGGCFAPEGSAWCSPCARGAFGCRASSFPHSVVCTRLSGSWIPGLNQGSALPAAALLPTPLRSPGAEQHHQGKRSCD